MTRFIITFSQTKQNLKPIIRALNLHVHRSTQTSIYRESHGVGTTNVGIQKKRALYIDKMVSHKWKKASMEEKEVDPPTLFQFNNGKCF